MDITKVHYDTAAAIGVKAKKKIPAAAFVVVAGEVEGRNPVVDVAGAGAVPLGVVAHEVEQGGYVTVYRAGHVLDLVAGGAITAGDKISCGADGKAVKATDGPVVGIALMKATNGKHVTVALL